MRLDLGGHMEVSEPYKLKPGDAAPDFRLPGTDGRSHALADFADAKALVVAFWCNHCPYVQAYEQRFIDWARDVKTKGVAVIAIGSNDASNYPEDDFPHMVERAKRFDYPFPYVRDQDQKVAEAYGAQCTPHFLVFDGERRLVHQGRFDDHREDAAKAKRRYVPEAVDAVLRGESPAETHSWAIGCSIKWSP